MNLRSIAVFAQVDVIQARISLKIDRVIVIMFAGIPAAR